MKYLRDVLLMMLVVSAIVFCGLFWVQTNRLAAAVDELQVSYTTHNRISAASVTIVDGEYDAGLPAVFKAE